MAPLLLLAALVSGGAALAAEVVWFRALGRGVGTSAEALAVVSAAFLGGLGIGAAIAARLAPRSTRPLRAAAICEAVAGVLVCLSPFAVALVPDAHRAVLAALGLSPGRSAWPAALVAVPILVIPASFLGATLPFLVRSRIVAPKGAGGWTGTIYAVNTLGAAVGVVVAVWVLLPGLGEAGSLRLAGCGNLAAAFLLLLLAERPSARAAAGEASPAPAFAPPPPPPDPAAAAALTEAPAATAAPPAPDFEPSDARAAARRGRAVGLALFASGAVALGGEVAWLRLLEPIVGVHLYGFVFLLVSVLLGTALGGAVGGALAERVRRPDLWLAGSLAAGGALTVASVWVAGHVPTWTLHAGTLAKEWDWSVSRVTLATRVLSSALAVLPPLAVFATAYPLAVRARAQSVERATAAVGSVYAWNTAGNVAGSLAAGFVLLPALGGPMTLAAFGGLGCLCAAALWLESARPRPALLGAAFLVVPALLVLPGAAGAVSRGGPSLREVVALSRWSDAYRIRSRGDLAVFCDVVVGTYPRPAFRPAEPPIEPVEGVVGNVGLLDEKEVRLRQGGLSESRFNRSDPNAGSETEVGLALVPYVCHSSPRRACVIGHGAGWTCETWFAAEDLERVDVAEIETAVIRVVERYRGTLEVRTSPKARLHVADGRLLLREAAAAGGTYDLIASQPSHPWVPGAGHLFTKEAYALARKALRKGGVFSQWLNVFDMNRDLFHTALAAFRDAFPDCWVLHYDQELVLVGFTEPPKVDWPRWERVLAADGVGLKARAAGIRGPEDLLRRLALDGESVAKLIPPGHAPASDDDPRLELGLALRRLFSPADRQSEMDAIKAEIKGAFAPRLEVLIPDARTRERAAARVLLRHAEDGRIEEARAWERAVKIPGGPDAHRARALLEVAAAKGLGAAERAPHVARALELFKAAADAAPLDPRDVLSRLDLLLDEGRTADAVREGREAAARFKDDGRVWSMLANALATSEQPEAADEAFAKAAAARSPRAPAGTGLRHARMLLSLARPRPLDAVAALNADPSTWNDREALRRLHDKLLEGTAEDTTGQGMSRVREVADRLAELDRAYGVERLATAKRTDKLADALAAAREAAATLPDSLEAWRLLGWFSLRKGDLESSSEAFQKALSLTKDPAGERERIEAMYRIHGQDPAALEAPAP